MIMKQTQLKIETPNGEFTFIWERKGFSLIERKFEERRVRTGLRSAKTVSELGEKTLYPSTTEVLGFLAQNKGLLTDLQGSEEFAHLAHLYEMMKDEFEQLQEITARAQVVNSELQSTYRKKARIQKAVKIMLQNVEVPFKPAGQLWLEKRNSEELHWEDIDPGRRHNGYFLGGFHAEWRLDAGYVQLYLKEPTRNDQNWYLKFVYPKNEYGERFKRTIKAKYLHGVFEYFLNHQDELDFEEILEELFNCVKEGDDNFSDQNRRHMDETLSKF